MKMCTESFALSRHAKLAIWTAQSIQSAADLKRNLPSVRRASDSSTHTSGALGTHIIICMEACGLSRHTQIIFGPKYLGTHMKMCTESFALSRHAKLAIWTAQSIQSAADLKQNLPSVRRACGSSTHTSGALGTHVIICTEVGGLSKHTQSISGPKYLGTCMKICTESCALSRHTKLRSELGNLFNRRQTLDQICPL